MLHVDIEKRLSGFELAAAFGAGDEIVALFGPSGAGKSLTLQTIAGIVRPNRGSISLNGDRVFDSEAGVNVPPQKRRIGYVPQAYALFPHLTVAQNIGYGLSGLPRGERAQRIREMIDLLGLHGLETRRPRQLSGGQQQRVSLARALVFQPRVLLLDEPFAALDEAIRATLRQELLDIQRKLHTTTVLVTHDLREAFALGDRIAVLDNGRILQEGPREEVYYHPASPRAAELTETRNVLRGTVVDVEGDTLRLDWRGHLIEAPHHPLPGGQAIDFCIRASRVNIVRPGRPAGGGRPHNLVEGRVVREDLAAESYLLFVRLTDSSEPYDLQIELPISVYYRLDLDRDKDVVLSLKREAIHVMPTDAAAPQASPGKAIDPARGPASRRRSLGRRLRFW